MIITMSQQPGSQGYEQQAMYRALYNNMKMQVWQQQQSTYALYSTGSPTLHQAHEQHQERTGEETGLNVQYTQRRPRRTLHVCSYDTDFDDQDDRTDEHIEDIEDDRTDEHIEEIGVTLIVSFHHD